MYVFKTVDVLENIVIGVSQQIILEIIDPRVVLNYYIFRFGKHGAPMECSGEVLEGVAGSVEHTIVTQTSSSTFTSPV